jgi:cell division protein FtsW (lipid II flippase)
MRGYLRLFKEMLWDKDISILYFIFGCLMFVASVVQLDDPINKVDPNVEHPVVIAWLCTIMGAFTILISPLSKWFIIRNWLMALNVCLSLYLIVDAGENIIKGANGVWFVALAVYLFLFARSQKDLIQDKKRYIRKEDNKC